MSAEGGALRATCRVHAEQLPHVSYSWWEPPITQSHLSWRPQGDSHTGLQDKHPLKVYTRSSRRQAEGQLPRRTVARRAANGTLKRIQVRDQHRKGQMPAGKQN